MGCVCEVISFRTSYEMKAFFVSGIEILSQSNECFKKSIIRRDGGYDFRDQNQVE